jgi:uncharacterized protein (TIGR03790 family)
MRFLILFMAAAPLWALGPENVLIVANTKVQGSVEIAEHYASLRGIDAARILKISASEQEEITREEFDKDIRGPVRAAVLADAKICVIVPTRGVPLKVRDRTPDDNVDHTKGHDEASVDSELILIREESPNIDGALVNSLFQSTEGITPQSPLIIVSRLDGPSVEIAKGLVDKAILAETLGCSGRCLLDTRGDGLGDGYLARDITMRNLGANWAKVGHEFDHDPVPDVVDLSTAADLLHYFGWYATTQKPAGRVRFRTGAIAAHLHSFSASIVRSHQHNWVGPLLAWNATASYGTVYEPYLVTFPEENVLWDRLVDGFTFGEAGLIASSAISWQTVFCGDPLYRPYPKDRAELHARYRAALMHVLAPTADAEAPNADGLTMLDTVTEMLKARQESVKTQLKQNPTVALREMNALRFDLADMGIDVWLSALSEPFKAELKKAFDAIKAQIKQDLTDTAELERALSEWKGIEIHEDLVKYRAAVVKDQERAAARLVKQAVAEKKAKRWLRAWINASQAAGHRFAGSAVGDAQGVLSEMRGDQEIMKALVTDADKALKPVVDKAQKELDKGKPDRAAKALGRDWRWYPDCDGRKAAEGLSSKITGAE